MQTFPSVVTKSILKTLFSLLHKILHNNLWSYFRKVPGCILVIHPGNALRMHKSMLLLIYQYKATYLVNLSIQRTMVQQCLGV